MSFFKISAPVNFLILIASAAVFDSRADVPMSSSSQQGTITQVTGQVQVFSHPSQKGGKLNGPAPHALFEGETYSVRTAKLGDIVDQGNIVRTAPGAQTRVVFENGDQFHVGSATSYRVKWGKTQGKTQVNLMYGKLRGIIEKGGPRTGLSIRTRSATMGVRGTDFFIATGGADHGTEVSVLRGSVAVTVETTKSKKAPVMELKSGYSTGIVPEELGKPNHAPPEIELRKTTQEELRAIQKSSEITQVPKGSSSSDALLVSPEVKQKVDSLEARALATTMKDIERHDPVMFAQLKVQSKEMTPQTVDQLNAMAVNKMVEKAPKAPEKRKPYKSEIEDLESGAYENYHQK